MTKTKSFIKVPDEIVMNKIYFIREQKVMLDSDLAELYGVETKVLQQAVKRYIDRFPEDFMFEMNGKEFEILRSQFVTSSSKKNNLRGNRKMKSFLQIIATGKNPTA